MSWAMVGAAAISTVGGLFGSSSAQKAQKEANKIAKQQLAFNKQRYNDYQNQYGGLIDLVVSDAEKGVTADLGRVTSEANADVASQFNNAQVAINNQQQRLGINPNSGRAESANRQLSLGQAVATAGNVTNARNTERRNADEQTWNRRYGVYQQGNSLITGAANDMNNTTSNMQTSAANSAATQGAAANQALASGASLFTQSLLNNPNLFKGNQTTTQPVSNIDSATKGLKVNGTQVGSGVLYDNVSSAQPKVNNTIGSFLG